MKKNLFHLLFTCAHILGCISAAHAVEKDEEFDTLLSLDIDQLTVTSVSLREQKLNTTAAAVYVITNEDIKRMGATSIPEALRMVPGLDVAQSGAHSWSVSARGFSGGLANKMLVLIDGRAVYTPVFSGTYWDDQATLLEDVERIEVIRGSGGTLYGSNAVNGIISIITKHSKDTQGNFAAASLGTEERGISARHGGRIAEDEYFRTYAQLQDRDSSAQPGGGQNFDDWSQLRSGFRMDRGRKENGHSFTLQGDAYGSLYENESTVYSAAAPYTMTELNHNDSFGGNLLGRWNYAQSQDSKWETQTYLDYYNRADTNSVESVGTADVKVQNNINLNERNKLIWGGGARLTNINVHDSFSIGVVTNHVRRHLLNLFVQDEYALIPNELSLIMGSKFEHNSFTGLELQPNARLMWQPTRTQTVWAAVARNVRTPSEIEDQAVFVYAIDPTIPFAYTAGGNSDPDSEKMISYELGYRVQPLKAVSLDTSLFYNDYEDLLAFGPFSAPFIRRGILSTTSSALNIGSGKTYGLELASHWRINNAWRLSGSYTYTEMDLDTPPPALLPFYDEDATPDHKLSLRSYWDISDRLKWDNMLYLVDETTVNGYARYDTRIAWQAGKGVELSLIGRNLLDSRHAEYSTVPAAEIERSVLGTVTMNF